MFLMVEAYALVQFEIANFVISYMQSILYLREDPKQLILRISEVIDSIRYSFLVMNISAC